MGDDDEYWNSSSAGGFSWDGEGGEGGVAASLSGALAGAGAGGQSSDTISFEPGVGPATSGELAERVGGPGCSTVSGDIVRYRCGLRPGRWPPLPSRPSRASPSW